MARTATAATKTKVKATPKKAAKAVATKTTVKTKSTSKVRNFKWDFTPGALIAEFLGSMLLVTAIIITSGNQFYIGITLIALAAIFMGMSGVNFNPAVSFGLWAMRRMSAIRMAAYWVAQFLGALAATLTLHLFSGERLGLNLSSFLSFDGKIFSLEAIGMAVFMFAFAAAWTMREGVVAKAATMGLGLFVGLVVASGFLSEAARGASTSQSEDTPRISKVSTATLNPAAALVIEETDPASQQLSLGGESADSGTEQMPSRFTLETVLGTLFGAAIGANLYLLLAAQRREDDTL